MKKQQENCCLFPFLLFLCTLLTSADNFGKGTFTSYAKQLFEQAAKEQKQQRYSKAIPIYQELIELTPPDEEIKEVNDILAEGLIQMMYCYIFDNRREEGANYFNRIYTENTCWVVSHATRDVEICLAYSLYEAAQPDKAKEVIDRALSRSITGRTYQLLYADYGISSVIYNQVGQIDKAIECNLKSIEILRKLDDNSNIIFALGNLIWQYQQIGELEKSLAAYDELIQAEATNTNPYGVCAAEINVVELYSEWGLEEEVRIHLAKAMEAANACGIAEAKLRTFTRSVYQALLDKNHKQACSDFDSMLVYLPQKEQSNFYHALYEQFNTVFALQTKNGNPQAHIAEARRQLRELKKRQPDSFTILFCRLIGDALAENGEKELAAEAYTNCCDYIRHNHLLNHQRHIFYALAILLTDMQQTSEAARYLKEAQEANRVFNERHNAKMLSQFRIKYETNEKEQANKLLTAELKLKRRTLEYYTSIIIGLLLAGCLIGLWITVRQRESRQKMEKQEYQLKQMLTDNQQINKRNEELRARLEQIDAQNSVQEIINRLSPQLLTYEEETEFRRKFALIHPAFLTKVREACPEITRSEELLLMLFRLNLTPEEVSFALGNNRASVYSSRSRLKRKLKIDKDTSVEDFIKSL